MLSLLFPIRCAGCQEPAPSTLCVDCATPSPRALAAPAGVTAALALAGYDSGLGRAIAHAKAAGDRDVAVALARVFARCADAGSASRLVPAPTTAWRRFRRGFHLSALLAAHLARSAGTPVDDVLHRHGGARQSRLSGAARRENLVGRVTARRPVRGAVLLVDDVLTTGATAEACAQQLLAAGATRVDLLVVCDATGAGHSL